MNWREVLATTIVCLLCGSFAVAAYFISSDLNERATVSHSVVGE